MLTAVELVFAADAVGDAIATVEPRNTAKIALRASELTSGACQVAGATARQRQVLRAGTGVLVSTWLDETQMRTPAVV